MKKTLFLITIYLAFSAISFGQQGETFDIVTFQTPKGWQKQVEQNAVAIGVDNAGGTCLITVFKSIPGSADAKENFNMAWKTIVKESLTVATSPQMNPPGSEDGWTVESGAAPYESDGRKGLALLLTATGNSKMVNVLILTNSQAFQAEIESFIASITLPKIVPQKPAANVQPANNAPTAVKSSFKFSTTNFDDGWTSTEQADWVLVTKGSVKVFLHYPKEGTIFAADPEPLINAAWNILVAPRYQNLKNYTTGYISAYERGYIGRGYATDPSTGKQVLVVLFRQGDSGWIEASAPDKNSFIQEFKFDPETVRYDTDSAVVNPLRAMVSRNKFAIDAGDLTGAWSSDFTGVQQMYSVVTGNYAGMNINQSREDLIFGPGSTYSWKLLVANGMVGTIKFANVKSEGKFSVPNNWQIHFTKIESGPKTYNAHWSCIKGARLLNLIDANAPGSGMYTVFGKK